MLEEKFTEPQLRKFNNWSRSTTASHYTHLNVDDIANMMGESQRSQQRLEEKREEEE